MSDIPTLARQVVDRFLDGQIVGEPVNVSVHGYQYRLKAYLHMPYVLAEYDSSDGWCGINDHGWRPVLLAEVVNARELRDVQEAMARVVLAAMFAGVDLRRWRCGQVIGSY